MSIFTRPPARSTPSARFTPAPSRPARSGPSRPAPRPYRAGVAVAALVAIVLVAAPAAGCANGDDGGQTPQPTPAPTRTGPAATPSVTGTPTGAVSTPAEGDPATPAAGEVTVTGEVVPGVEPNCLVLRGDGSEYLLIAESAAVTLPTSGRVTVVGRTQTDLATTCMQGIPLVVREVRPA